MGFVIGTKGIPRTGLDELGRIKVISEIEIARVYEMIDQIRVESDDKWTNEIQVASKKKTEDVSVFLRMSVKFRNRRQIEDTLD